MIPKIRKGWISDLIIGQANNWLTHDKQYMHICQYTYTNYNTITLTFFFSYLHLFFCEKTTFDTLKYASMNLGDLYSTDNAEPSLQFALLDRPL